MIILIQNTTDEVKYIYRFSGVKMHINPNSFIDFNCDDTDELNYWCSISSKPSTNGVFVITDSAKIQLYKKLDRMGKYTEYMISKKTKSDIEEVTVEPIEVTDEIIMEQDNIVEVVESPNAVEVEETPEEIIEIIPEDTDTTISESVVEELESDIEINSTDIITDETADTLIVEDVITETVEVEDTASNEVETESTESSPIETSDIDITYTEEALSKMTKTDLQDILTKMNVPFKKNNSVSTLTNLILENQ